MADQAESEILPPPLRWRSEACPASTSARVAGTARAGETGGMRLPRPSLAQAIVFNAPEKWALADGSLTLNASATSGLLPEVELLEDDAGVVREVGDVVLEVLAGLCATQCGQRVF